MQSGKVTLEYLCLSAFAVAAIIAVSIYVNRGFQGHFRNLSEQISVDQYAPGNTIINNRERKRIVSEITSKSTTTTTYEVLSDPPAPESQDASRDLRYQVNSVINSLRVQADPSTLNSDQHDYGGVHPTLNFEINRVQGIISDINTRRAENNEEPPSPKPEPVISFSETHSENIERSTVTIRKNVNESLGGFDGDARR
jgi:hypothetical protein